LRGGTFREFRFRRIAPRYAGHLLGYWTIGRPLKIQPSIRTSSGKGSRNLYRLEDVYLLGLAYELSKAGMAAKAIGKLLEAVQAKRSGGLGNVEVLTVWRPSGKLKFEVRKGKVQPSAGVLIWQTVNVAAMLKRISAAVQGSG
jgi:hypothetical protein